MRSSWPSTSTGRSAQGRAARALALGQHERDAALHHHQRGAVLLRARQREHPNALADWLLDLNLGWVGFLLVVNLLLLIAGNFMEPSSIILIMAPILFPTAMRLGIDPVHFGILIDVNMEVGPCHPPVGPQPLCGVGHLGARHHDAHQGGDAWLMTMLVFLVIVTYWPWLTLVVPRALNMM
jgi:C4-dicarboxylate transporter DctM subunit